MFVGDLDTGDVIDTVVVVGKVGHGDDPAGMVLQEVGYAPKE